MPPTHVFDVILVEPSFPSLFLGVGGKRATYFLDGGSDECIFDTQKIQEEEKQLW